MTNGNDSSEKGPLKPGTDSAGKKPAAILDLKATEVDIRDPKKSEAGAGSSSSGTKPVPAAATPAGSVAPSMPTAGTSTGTSTGATSAPTAAPGTKPASANPHGQQGATKSDAMPSQTSTSATSAASSSSAPAGGALRAVPSGGLRSAATHLAAGLAGGLLALIGAENLGSQFGLTGAGQSGASLDVMSRLQKLESSTRGPSVIPDAGPKLAAAEARIAQLERIARQFEALSQQQVLIAGETKALRDKIVSGAPDSGAEARIGKLEESLGALANAASTDPQRGRIPQLAAILGRLTDLEGNINTQIGALRKGVTQEVDSRLGQSAEASEAARTGTQRVDRELAGVKTEAVQLAQRMESLKSTTDRFEIGLRGLRDDATALKADVSSIKDELSRELKQVARPSDVSNAMSPVASRLAMLEQNVQGVVRSEDERRMAAERIVMALELGNLKRTIDRGAGYSKELAEVRRVTGGRIDLGVLDRFKDIGVPTVAELERDFRPLAHAMIDADAQPANAHWTDRLLAGAKSVVRIRKVDQGADDAGVEARVARMESSLKAGKLADVLTEAGKLGAKTSAPARGWLDKIEARAAVERAMAAIEGELKASLGAGTQTPGPTPAGKRG